MWRLSCLVRVARPWAATRSPVLKCGTCSYLHHHDIIHVHTQYTILHCTTYCLFNRYAYACAGVRTTLCARSFSSTIAKSPGSKGHSKGQLWLLIIPATTFCLGTWQIYRLQWKIDLIEKLEKKTKRSPVPIPTEWVVYCTDKNFRVVKIKISLVLLILFSLYM